MFKGWLGNKQSRFLLWIQILERKNAEIEEVKLFYRQKLKEQEDLIARSDEKSYYSLYLLIMYM